MGIFICSLRSAHCRVLHIVAGSYYSSSNMWLPFTCNDLLATVYLQWFTCDANFHSIEMIIASSHMRYHRKAYENPRLIVKPVLKSNWNWPKYQRIAIKIFSSLRPSLIKKKAFPVHRPTGSKTCE